VAVTPALARVQVGQYVPVQIDSAKNYPGSSDGASHVVWEQEIVQSGATYISLHFRDFALAPSDYLTLSDASGGQSYRLQGHGKRDAGAFWARHIKGDTIRLQLHATSPNGAQGFVIDDMALGNSSIGSDPEAICGIDDKENAVCYETTHPAEYAGSRPVARMLISGAFLCTGWLASANNHFVTNEHCVTNATEALNTDFEFMAEAATCGSGNCQLCHPGDLYDGAAFIQDNAGLDYALLQINSGDPAGQYGYLGIDNRNAIVGERIYIPQHPGGRAKEIGIESSHSSDGSDGMCHVNSISSPPCSGSGYNDVGYYCDTEGGSSGSPVIAASNNKVIALHHCANCPNRGVPIDLVWAEIGGLLGPECTVNADCDDGLWCNGEETCVDQSCQAGSDPCPVGCDEANDLCTSTICGNGTCEVGEDCGSCGQDCPRFESGFCGNGTCEPSLGEDCLSCSQDCNGKQNGNPSGRFCCGDASTPCSDSRCSVDAWSCSSSTAGSTCCGDGTCEGLETSVNCLADCPEAVCGDGNCDAGEDSCACAADCGSPGPEQCGDGQDNDCDGAVDCADADCSDTPACACLPTGTSCSNNGECCSERCRGRGGNKTCI